MRHEKCRANVFPFFPDGRQKKLATSTNHSTVPLKRKHYSDNDYENRGTPLDDQMDRFVDRLVAKTPNSSAGGAFPQEQRSDQGSSVDNTFYTGDNLNTFDFNFDFGSYGDPFADIMRMTEASLTGNNAVSGQSLWPWD